MKTESHYGLLLEKYTKWDTTYVVAKVVRRDNGDSHPLNISGFRFELPKHMEKFELAGLGIYGFVSDYSEPTYIGYEVEYKNMHSIGLGEAKRMATTLAKIKKRIALDEAREPGDVLVSLMKVLKLTFAVRMIGTSKGSSYADNEWLWTNGTAGARNMFRDMIDAAVTEVKEKKRAA